jgi:methyl-accepting chemotaxis protein
MAKLRNWIGNLKVAAKLKVYRMAVLVMTAFFVLVALVSTVVIRKLLSFRHKVLY